MQNILFLQFDQLTPFLMGCYDNPNVHTPYLDRLKNEGVRFDAAYSPHPVCSPARTCMMTGKYPSTVKAWDNAAPLHCDEVTLAHYLTNAGYDTVLSGKMHYVGPDQLHGFRTRFMPNIYPADFRWVAQAGPEGETKQHYKNYLGKNLHIDQRRYPLEYDEGAHLHGINYLHRQGNAKNRVPFFLFLSYHHPHEPFFPPQKYWDMYKDADVDLPHLPEDFQNRYSEMDNWLQRYAGINTQDIHDQLSDKESTLKLRRAYCALVTYIDDKVGEIIETLEKFDLLEKTLIIASSDHGDMLADKNMVQKRSFYEWSARIPLIFRFPNKHKMGTIVNEPVNLIDLMPTVLDYINFPTENIQPQDGQSMMPLINDGQTDWITFSENHADGNIKEPCIMARKGPWKYIYIHNHQHQLFNLDNDPGEWNNLIDDPQHQDIAKDLQNTILNRFDINQIKKEVTESIARRKIIHTAMEKNRTDWSADYTTDYDRP